MEPPPPPIRWCYSIGTLNKTFTLIAQSHRLMIGRWIEELHKCITIAVPLFGLCQERRYINVFMQ